MIAIRPLSDLMYQWHDASLGDITDLDKAHRT